MTREKIELLQDELAGLQLAVKHLEYSLDRCLNLIGQKEIDESRHSCGWFGYAHQRRNFHAPQVRG